MQLADSLSNDNLIMQLKISLQNSLQQQNEYLMQIQNLQHKNIQKAKQSKNDLYAQEVERSTALQNELNMSKDQCDQLRLQLEQVLIQNSTLQKVNIQSNQVELEYSQLLEKYEDLQIENNRLKTQISLNNTNLQQISNAQNQLNTLIRSHDQKHENQEINEAVQSISKYFTFFKNQITQIANANEQKRNEINQMQMKINDLQTQITKMEFSYQNEVLDIADLLFIKCKSMLTDEGQHETLDKVLSNLSSFLVQIQAQKINAKGSNQKQTPSNSLKFKLDKK
ncbi:Hypothetical_protein [Hexamita inflata]|uniref:Hypothetical_protein n=1 Tax=Hexamita inflata TaxID=28002 RepID=A0AA86TRK0_9EUKA|nr:Hypothetical protein HINF_LOCUS14152 [Hexamita inflata]CAI9926514.1 Hypothetical protein HINF_LOCUS14159 [Hexamita inflata]